MVREQMLVEGDISQIPCLGHNQILRRKTNTKQKRIFKKEQLHMHTFFLGHAYSYCLDHSQIFTKKGDKHETKKNLQKETHAHAYTFSLPYSYSYCVGHNLIYKEGRQTRNNKEGLNNIKKKEHIHFLF